MPHKKTTTSPTARSFMLRTCDSEMRAYGGFVWPTSGPVSAPDWKPTEKCGSGLHGLLMGVGDTSQLSIDADAKWLVVEIDPSTAIELAGKVKVPGGIVVYCGDRDGAIAFLIANGGDASKMPFHRQDGGDRSTLTGGDHSTLTGGDGSTLTGGYRSTLIIRYWDASASRYRLAVGEVVEGALKAGVAYRVVGGSFAEIVSAT